MRLQHALLTTTSALVLGLFVTVANAEPAEAPGARSDITIVKDTVPSTGGVESSAAGDGADNMNTPDQPMTGAGSQNLGGPNAENQGGTGVSGSAESRGVTNKDSASVPSSGAGSANMGGPNSADQGGTGIKGSADGRGATDKSTE